MEPGTKKVCFRLWVYQIIILFLQIICEMSGEMFCLFRIPQYPNNIKNCPEDAAGIYEAMRE